jgi:hypothetical protein
MSDYSGFPYAVMYADISLIFPFFLYVFPKKRPFYGYRVLYGVYRQNGSL